MLGLLALVVICAPQPVHARRHHGHRHHAPLHDAPPQDAQTQDAPAPDGTASAAEAAPETQRILVDVPTPPERPPEFSVASAAQDEAAQASPEAPQGEALAYAAPVEPEREEPPFVAPALSGTACLRKLREAGIEFETAGQPHATLAGCHIDTPVNVSALPVAGRRVELPAKPLLDCAYALQFADFTARLAAPLGAKTLHSTLVALDTGPGYECRGRNRVRGARVSAHGKGIALDVSGFIFDDGRKVVVQGQRDAASHAYFAGFRKGACNWFDTVLGPGSDGYHESHLHLDTEHHGRHAMHYCH